MTVKYVGPNRRLVSPIDGVSTLRTGEIYDLSDKPKMRAAITAVPSHFELIVEEAPVTTAETAVEEPAPFKRKNFSPVPAPEVTE